MPHIYFGRYSDAYKTSRQYDAWDAALEYFEKKEYLRSYIAFFEYLRDEKEDNVSWKETDGQLHFELLQGSKKIIGVADQHKIKAEAKVAKAKKLNVNFMHQLVTRNFGLEYSRFALDHDDNITIVFDSFALDGSPYKLYYAIRELATNADKQDDLLIDEFRELQPIENSHLKALPDLEKEAKYNFIVNKIETALKEVDEGSLRAEQYPGGIAYLLLDLCYRLDYLTKPEGFMMEALERMNRQYFGKKNTNTAQKNLALRKDLEKLLERSRDDFYKEMYIVRTTFGITKPINFERVKGIILGELPNMDWYQENGYDAVALAIPGYIVGNCLFNYALPKPLRAYFELYYAITEGQYFCNLGFPDRYYQKGKKGFDKKAIKNKIREISRYHRKTYYRLNPDLGYLRFSNLADFCRSYLQMITQLDLSRKE